MTEREFELGLELLAKDRRKGSMVSMYRRMGFRRGGKALERALKGVSSEFRVQSSQFRVESSELKERGSDPSTSLRLRSGTALRDRSSELKERGSEKKAEAEAKAEEKSEGASERGGEVQSSQFSVQSSGLKETGTSPIGSGLSDRDEPVAERSRSQPEQKRLREDFGFLGDDDCPEVLKVLVSDMITTHGRYVKGHERLFDVAHKSPSACFKAAETVVENYIENRRIWAELDHYKRTRTLLGEHPIFERIKREEALKSMTDADRKKYKESIRKKIWKRNAMLKEKPNSEHAERWREEIKEFERLKG
jgi:hypothetical protein